MYSNLCLGIDFGTTNSCLSVWHNNRAIIINDIDGSAIIPTVINITETQKNIGKHACAIEKIFNNNIFLVYEIKKLLGKKYSDLDEQQISMLSYVVNKDENDNILIHDSVLNNNYRPAEIATHLFMSFKLKTETFLSEKFKEEIKITNAVISVPAYFNKIQREIIKQCATNSGLIVKRLINEPTAAALCYGIGKNSKESTNIVVFDFGGGTLDISLLNICDSSYEVLSCSGNSNLGGSNYDEKIMKYCIEEFTQKNKLNIDIVIEEIDENSVRKLKYLSEKCKIALSDNLVTKIIIDDFYKNIRLNVTITREKFNEICYKLNQKIVEPLANVIIDSEIKLTDVNEIIMVGGMTKVPTIRQIVENYFGKDVNNSIDPYNVVAIGCAIHGYMLLNKSDLEDKLLLIDRTSLSIGVETSGGIMNTIISRGSIMPITKKKKYTTDKDYVDSINIKIYEGERQYTRDNFLIGDFVLTGIEKEKRGIPKIEITFEIDMDGIIKVKAEDLNNSLNKKTIQINNNNKMSEEQIQQIIDNAKIMDEIDRTDCLKKNSYMSLIDMSNRIIENINVKSLAIEPSYKEEIINNVNHVLNLLNETTYDLIDIEKYKELIKSYKYNYGIYLIQSNNPIHEFKSSEEIDDDVFNTKDGEKGCDIYDEELNNKKYGQQIEYVRNMLNEYDLIKKQSMMDIDINDDLLLKINNVLNSINDFILQMFIRRDLTDEIVEENISYLNLIDIEFKKEYDSTINDNNIVLKLSNLIDEKEKILLAEFEKYTNNTNNTNNTNDTNDTNITNNDEQICKIKNNIDTKLNIVMEFSGYVYKINNNYIERDIDKINEMYEILKKLDVVNN